MRLNGKASLPQIAEQLKFHQGTLYRLSREEDFPPVETEVGYVRLYDVSKVARYLGVPIL